MANIVASLLNPLVTVDADPKKAKRSKNHVTAADVLGKKQDKPKARTPEEQLQVFRRMTKRMGGVIHDLSPN